MVKTLHLIRLETEDLYRRFYSNLHFMEQKGPSSRSCKSLKEIS